MSTAMREAAPPTLDIDPSLAGVLRVALVWGFGLPGCPEALSPGASLLDLVGRVRRAGEAFLTPERKAAVRNMLRHGKYKPAGRSKPSSEYLLAAALEGDPPLGGFPLVNGPVNANNEVSLEWGYPASVFDLAKTGSEFLLRRGLAGEAFVFNRSGQTIDLEDLVVVCGRASGSWEPCGNPVKDSLSSKVFGEARDVAAIVYAPVAEPEETLAACGARYAELLRVDCGAAASGYLVLG